MNRCVYCDREVNPADRYVLQRIQGWEKHSPSSSRRSGSDIVARERVQEFAHAHCVERVKMGVPVQQGALL